jgi:hypothetical protein
MPRIQRRHAAWAAAIAIVLSTLPGGDALCQPAEEAASGAQDSEVAEGAGAPETAAAAGAAEVAPTNGAAAAAAAAPRIGVTAELDPRTATVGDRLALRLTLTRPDGIDVVFPAVDEAVAPLEVRETVILPLEERDGVITEARHYVLVAFDTGTLRVPGLGFSHVTATGDTIEAWTDTLFVTIESVLPAGKAPEELEPRDIKPPFELPRRIWPYLVAVAIIAAAVAVWWYLRRWWRARKREPRVLSAEEPRVPPRAAHVIAFERLRQLEQEDAIGRGQIPRFYVGVTAIVRLYLRDRFAVGAIDMTTSELEPAMKAARIEREVIGWTIDFLTHADLTKFAKHVPEPSCARDDFREAWDFVERTRFRTEEVASDEEDGDARAESSAETATPGEDDRAEVR